MFRRLNNKDQLAALTVGGVLIGDLVIDAYLRFKPNPELNLGDWYLVIVLRQAIKDIESCRAYFRKVKPTLYISTYTTYVQHGVPVRVALDMGISTWAFANAQEYGTRLSPDHPLQSRRNLNYSRDFARLEARAELINAAADQLDKRLSGVADTVTSFLRSAYQIRTHDVPVVAESAVVFLHDFYDSPHIYRWMIFHDFWEWTCTTIEVLQEAGVSFFVKPHPSQREEAHRDLALLRRKYPDVRFLSADVSNRQLVDAGMACAVTVYGSVAAEMAFMGVPTISCGDNPHASFDAFHLATSKDQYREMLRNIPHMSAHPDRLREQACAFYYMHNLSDGEDALELRERLFEYIRYYRRVEAGEPLDGMLLGHFLNGIEATRAFRSLAATLRADARGHQLPSHTTSEGARQCLPMPRR
jgi:hypothetical protein